MRWYFFNERRRRFVALKRLKLAGIATTIFLTSCQPGNDGLLLEYQNHITKEQLASHVYFLASDVTEGRQTGTRGQEIAALYLASQFLNLGLLPIDSSMGEEISPDNYFQEVLLNKWAVKPSTLEVSVGGNRKAASLVAPNDLSFFSQGTIKEAKGSVVFGGFGIAADSLGYNDFAELSKNNIAIDNKWLLIFADEPLLNDTTSWLKTFNQRPSAFSSGLGLGHKKKAIWQYGRPAGVLVIMDASPRFEGTFAESAGKAVASALQDYHLAIDVNKDTEFPPIYNISSKLANFILAQQGQTVDKLLKKSAGLQPVVFDLPAVEIEVKGEPYEQISTHNVAAFLEGSDPKLKNEVLVVSAHYDHLGRNLQLEGDQIFNGAADDASGAAAILALAEAFMEAKRNGHGPGRSILFINFTGEEHGKLGSQHYVYKQPLIPLDRTIANINLDGVGGIDPNHPTKSRNYVYVTSNELISDELVTTNSTMNTLTGIGLELTSGKGRPFFSDHQSFDGQLIPYLYYSTGLTEHYHQVTDEAHTLDYDAMTQITRLIFATAWSITRQEEPLMKKSGFSEVGFICPPCPFDCHDLVFEKPGVCPVCDMDLIVQVK